MPNMYARGILWGKMVLELGDQCIARNERLGLLADIQFKTRGYFSGTYNAIAGRVKRTSGNTELGEISGKWSSVMEYKPTKVRARPPGVCAALTPPQGEKRVLFDVHKDGQKIAPKWVAPEEEQEPNESRRCVLLLRPSMHVR